MNTKCKKILLMCFLKYISNTVKDLLCLVLQNEKTVI